MAKKFIFRVFLLTLVYLLLAGVITAGDNSSYSLTGIRHGRVYYGDIENFINEKILSRK